MNVEKTRASVGVEEEGVEDGGTDTAESVGPEDRETTPLGVCTNIPVGAVSLPAGKEVIELTLD